MSYTIWFLVTVGTVLAALYLLRAYQRRPKPKTSPLLPEATRLSKPKVWRIRRLPRYITDQELLAALDGASEQEGPLRISIAASSENYACATVTTANRPVLSMAGCSIDNDFLGITPLHDADDAAIEYV